MSLLPKEPINENAVSMPLPKESYQNMILHWKKELESETDPDMKTAIKFRIAELAGRIQVLQS